MTDNDFLASMRIKEYQTEALPVRTFDAVAASRMIEIHRFSEARLRDELAAKDAEISARDEAVAWHKRRSDRLMLAVFGLACVVAYFVMRGK